MEDSAFLLQEIEKRFFASIAYDILKLSNSKEDKAILKELLQLLTGLSYKDWIDAQNVRVTS